MDNREYYRPREAAVRQGRLRRFRLTACAVLSCLFLGGFAACFLVPEAHLSHFAVKTSLHGLSPEGRASAERPLTREMILEGMGVGGSEYCMFASSAEIERSLSEAWFVSPSPAPRVVLGPFSCDLYFQDVYPLAELEDGSVYLSSGVSYQSLAGNPDFVSAYPDPSSLSLVKVPTGVMNGYDYGDETHLSELLIDLAPIDPSILSSGWLSGACLVDGYLYLYLSFPETESGSRIRIAPADLSELSGGEMLGAIQEAIVSMEQKGPTHVPLTDPEDSWIGGEWYQLGFGTTESGRFGVVWEDGEVRAI